MVRVCQTWSRYGEGSVKNRRSRRYVKMTEKAYRALREQVAETELRFTRLWPVSMIHPPAQSAKLLATILEVHPRAGWGSPSRVLPVPAYIRD